MSLPTERLGVLVATINEKIEPVVRKLLPQLTNCDVVISHQVTDGYAHDAHLLDAHDSVVYSQISSRGLSKNRNNCLKHMTQPINLIADDDVEYIPDFERTILEAYEKHADADVITFRVEHGERTRVYKRTHFTHTRWSVLKAYSIGVTFHKEAIERSGVRFDERFGLGSQYVSGEENIFLKDCIDAGLRVIHVDEPIVRHTHLSSGWKWNREQAEAKIAITYRMYGAIYAFIAPLYFVWAKHALYREHMSAFAYLRYTYALAVRLTLYGL